MFWKDLLPLWQKTCKLPSVWLENIGKTLSKTMFWKDFLLKLLSLKSPHGGKPPLAPLTDRIKPAVWAATPREAGWITINNIRFLYSELCNKTWTLRTLDHLGAWLSMSSYVELPKKNRTPVNVGHDDLTEPNMKMQWCNDGWWMVVMVLS